MITGLQIRAAKAMVRWSGTDLAKSSGVSLSTIRRIEAYEGVPECASVKVLLAIQSALESAGVEFVGAVDNAPGVRLHAKK